MATRWWPRSSTKTSSAHDPRTRPQIDLEKLRAAINEKNLQFFYDYRAVNGAYIYGGRKTPFGIVNFPDEFAKLRKMIEVRDQRIWDVAQGKQVADKIDDSKTGEFESDPNQLQASRLPSRPRKKPSRSLRFPRASRSTCMRPKSSFRT